MTLKPIQTVNDDQHIPSYRTSPEYSPGTTVLYVRYSFQSEAALVQVYFIVRLLPVHVGRYRIQVDKHVDVQLFAHVSPKCKKKLIRYMAKSLEVLVYTSYRSWLTAV